jgi:hypothetical protein
VTGIEEVLALWRELERVHEQLPEDDPTRRAVADEIARIRDLYRRLTNESQQTATLLKASQRTIERAHGVIRSAETRLVSTPAWRQADPYPRAEERPEREADARLPDVDLDRAR